MKRRILIPLFVLLAQFSYGQNVKVVNPDTQPVPTKIISGTVSSSATGAATLATGQVTATTSPGTLVIARATRRQVTIKNTDAAITVYIGPATVTSANGMPLKAGESITVRSVGLIQVLAASGSPVVAFMDEYD